MNRRQIVVALGTLVATSARASEGLFPLVSDTGAPVANERAAADLYPAALAGAVLAGSTSPDVMLTEYFDYNCPTCRGCASQIDALLGADPGLQLRVFNNPILSAASLEAAKVQQAVVRAHGPAVAYGFHKSLLAIHGVADRQTALSTARRLGLNMPLIEAGADLPRVAEVVAAQLESAKNLDLTATPSFLIADVELLGWPGPKALASIVRSARACGKPLCGSDDKTGQAAAPTKG